MSNTAICTRSDHPPKKHWHYGYGGRHWCSDFGSALLSEDNMGDRSTAYIKAEVSA